MQGDLINSQEALSETVSSPHVPVLLEEAVHAFHPFEGRVYVDATLGGGGHALRLSQELSGNQVLLGLDRDQTALDIAKARLAGATCQVKTVRTPFSGLKHALFSQQMTQIDGGILVDLGMSNIQLKSETRGFSFQTDAPLDMRMDASQGVTAADIVNNWGESELADILHFYSDERLSKAIAKEIVACRPFKTTGELTELAKRVYHAKNCHPHNISPATRLFQALRMAVNEELKELETLLALLPELMAPGAIAAFISFHSVEDRLVKQFFKLASITCICPPRMPICQCGHQASFKILGKPITASEAETKANPQARSAKLRLAQRL